jgi:hypothetical protein
MLHVREMEPYATLDQLYRAAKEAGQDNDVAQNFGESRHFEDLLVEPEFFSAVPCLSATHMKPNTLVRFRGLVQDVFDPELYCSEYIYIAEYRT